MNQLIDAIYAAYAAGGSTFYTLTAGRLEYGRADASWSDNFAVVFGLGANPENCFRQSLDDVQLQFNCFSAARATCFSIAQACIDLFDNTPLTVADHHPVTMHREMYVAPIWNEQDQLWQATIEFSCMLQPT